MDYLSDCNIQHISYNKASKRLVIFYGNANIDLMNISNFEVTNLSDYHTASTTGDKTVNDIYMYGKYAYISNGFGIIKVNIADGEISDTYNLGFKVNWCEIKDMPIVRLTDNIVLHSPKTCSIRTTGTRREAM